MRIDHTAIWTYNLEGMRDFYEGYFGGVTNTKNTNPRKQFSSYFLTFDSGCRLELMEMPGIPPSADDVERQFTGYIHKALGVGSTEAVDVLTNRLRDDGYTIVSAPRTTGDGYYESVILDPDGNRVEITV